MGVPEKIDPGASWRKILGLPGMWTEFARDGQVSWSPDRRRRCGNVEIARPWFWRDFQARGEAWKSPGGKFLSAAGCRLDFSTLSTARHFHSDTLAAPPSPGRSGAPPETAEGSGCRDEGQRQSFSQEVSREG